MNRLYTIFAIIVLLLTITCNQPTGTTTTSTNPNNISSPSEAQASDGTYTNKIAISWSSVNNATNYKIYRASSSTGTYQYIGETGNISTNYDDATIEQGRYYYKVSACDSKGESNKSTFDGGNITCSIPQDLNRDASYPYSQEVILQGFYWYIGDKGSTHEESESDLYALYKNKTDQFLTDGITAIWMPPSGKAFSPDNTFNVGYSVYDHYDLGEFEQEVGPTGGCRTKYGTRKELVDAIDSLHAKGIKVIADIVMNHMLGSATSTTVSVSQSDPTGINSVDAYVNFDFNRSSDNDPRGDIYSSFHWTVDDFDGMESYDKYYLFSGHTLDNVNIFSGEDLFHSDIILGADVDCQNTEVYNEMVTWGKWLTDKLNLDGYRVDAIRHMDNGFVKNWANAMTSYNSGALIFGECWDGWSARLNAYSYCPPSGTGRDQTFNESNPSNYQGIQNSMQLFDVPLHYTFQKIAGDNASPGDLTMLLDENLAANSLLGNTPTYTITFVDNHDTVPDQELASYINKSFKLQSYCYILLNKSGTPCVFYRDMYKGNYTGKYTNDSQTEFYTAIKELINIRHKYAYGAGHTPSSPQSNNADILTYAREGASSGVYAGKSMVFVIAKPGKTGSQWIDTYGGVNKTFTLIAGDGDGHTTTTTNSDNSWGEFFVGTKGYSVWVEQ